MSKKDIIRSICFGICLIIVFSIFTNVYSFKFEDGIYGMTAFYEQEDNINDVLFVGSSQMFENVNTQILWDEYGMAAFDLAGSKQPIWNSYYYIKEALKTQNLSLVVLDLYSVLQEEEYSDDSRIIKNTYGMKLSEDRIEAIKVSSPEENRKDYLWKIPTYHTRYRELSKRDFMPHLGMPNMQDWKGYGMNPATNPYDTPQDFQTDETEPVTAKVEEYLRKICELCKEEGVELLFVKTPSHTYIGETMKYNRAGEIAAEYNVPYVNFNYYYDEMQLDFATDAADRTHLNYKGNVKFTRYLADYIKANYKIPDRRGEKGYESYEVMSRDSAARTQNAIVYDTQEFGVFLREIQRENYTVVYTISENCKNATNYEDMNALMKFCGIDMDEMEASSAWVFQGGKELFASRNSKDFLWYEELAPYMDIEVAPAEDEKKAPSIVVNRQQKRKMDYGINVVVYDSITETIVDAVGVTLIENALQGMKQR